MTCSTQICASAWVCVCSFMRNYAKNRIKSSFFPLLVFFYFYYCCSLRCCLWCLRIQYETCQMYFLSNTLAQQRWQWYCEFSLRLAFRIHAQFSVPLLWNVKNSNWLTHNFFSLSLSAVIPQMFGGKSESEKPMLCLWQVKKSARIHAHRVGTRYLATE